MQSGFAGMGTAQGSRDERGLLGASRGSTIALKPSLFRQLQTPRPSPLAEKTFYHELAHTRQSTPRDVTQGKGEDLGILHDESNERNADAAAELAFQGRQVESPNSSFTGGPSCVQALMTTARRQAESRRRFGAASKAYELHMGRTLQKDSNANAPVNLMLADFQRITNAWAIATGKQVNTVLVESFDWRGGDRYFGAFRMTAKNINRVFQQAQSKPLRQKLKIVYNAVRNNAFAKWLKIAAQQVEMEIQGVPQYNRTLQVENVDNNTTETVDPSFAVNSRLKEKMRNNRPRYTEVLHSVWNDEPLDRFGPVHKTGVSKFSSSMNWAPQTQVYNRDRVGGMNRNRDVLRMSPLKMKDLDLTDEEIHQIGINSGLLNSNVTSQRKINSFVRSYRAANGRGNRPIPWEKGTGYYDVLIGSQTEKLARGVRARLVAGVSGSTDLMLHAAAHLNFSQPNMKKLRLAMLAWMLEAEDHSFLEIMEASRACGLPFIRGNTAGEMYEIDENFTPKYASDFQMNFKSMLKDAPDEDCYPSALLDSGYVDDISLKNPNVKLAAYRRHYVALGIPRTTLASFSATDMADLEQLDFAVSKAPLKLGHGKVGAHNFQVRRQLRNSVAFIDLSHSHPIYSELLLTHLIKTRHGEKALGRYEKKLFASKEHLPQANDDEAARRRILRTAGVAAQLEASLLRTDLDQALELRALIQASDFDVSPDRDNTAITTNSKKLTSVKSSRPYRVLTNRLGLWMNALLGAFLAELDPSLRSEGLSLRNTNSEQANLLKLGIPETIAVMVSSQNTRLVKQLARRVKATTRRQNLSHKDRLAALKDLIAHGDFTDLHSALGPHNVRIIAWGIAQREGFNFRAYTRKMAKKKAVAPWAYATLGDILDSSSLDLDQNTRDLEKEQILARNYPKLLRNTGIEFMEDCKSDLLKNLNKPDIGNLYNDAHKQTFRGLDPVEVFAINQYTQNPGMGIWQNMLINRDATQKMTGLKKTIQEHAWVMKVAVAGLRRLPVHRGTVYNGQPLTFPRLFNGLYDMTVVNNYARNYPIGKIIRYDNFFSTAKNAATSFLSKDTHNLAWVIDHIRTGRDIQPISDHTPEEEVLFPPGAKFMVQSVDTSKVNLPTHSTDELKGKLVIHFVEI